MDTHNVLDAIAYDLKALVDEGGTITNESEYGGYKVTTEQFETNYSGEPQAFWAVKAVAKNAPKGQYLHLKVFTDETEADKGHFHATVGVLMHVHDYKNEENR